MSWNHGTFGWEAYEAFVEALKTVHTEYTETLLPLQRARGLDFVGTPQNLRMATFTAPDGRQMVCEEYLAVDDGDCDGRSTVAIAVYEQDHRPRIVTKVYDGGHWNGYPERPGSLMDRVMDFLFVTNDGTVEPMPREPEPEEVYDAEPAF